MRRDIKNRVGRLAVAALRHRPEILGLTVDGAGYCYKRELKKALREKGYDVNDEDLESILSNERFGVDKTGQKARVDYGNSLGIKLSDMYEKSEEPPEILFHGTSVDAVNSIKEEGIIRFSKDGNKPRDHVFLTDREIIAIKKGMRHGVGVALPVLARKMHEDGYLYYHAKNDIWLTDHIPPEYIDFHDMRFKREKIAVSETVE